MINKEKEQERGYFCSELVAKAYKNVGLLDEKKSSCRYWPVDFA
jgi:palmitoyltransferase